MLFFLFQGTMSIHFNRSKLLQLCNSSSSNARILLKSCSICYLSSLDWNLWVLSSVIWKIFEFNQLIYFDVYRIHHFSCDFIYQQLMHTFCKLITYLTLTCFSIWHLSMLYSRSVSVSGSLSPRHGVSSGCR